MSNTFEKEHLGMMAYRRKWLPMVALALLVLASCSHRVENRNEPAPSPPPPSGPVIATGNGEIVGGHSGREGGRLNLGPSGPGVAIPAGTAGPQGLSISLVKDSEAGVPAGGAHIGPPFRVSRPL